MTREKILEIISFISAVVSIISLFFVDDNWGTGKIIILISLIIVAMIMIYFLFIKSSTQKCKSQNEINEFMKTWIKTSGVVKILSRDMSWVDDEMLGILQTKGADLYLYVEKSNEIVEKIRKMNPEGNIIFYNDIGFVPNSRFTIIRANKDDRQIAITIKERSGYKKLEHEIYISNENPIDKRILGLANDLMNCIECKGKKND